MADIKKIKLGDTIYDIRDARAADILDVVKLPETGDSRMLYRLTKGTLIEKQIRRTDCSCTVVETLPTPTGDYPAESIISAEDAQLILQGQVPTVFNVYYKVDDKAYCYIPAALGQAFGLPVNWYDLTLIKNYVPALTYLGTITDIKENNVENGTFNILLEYSLYWYTNGVWNNFEQIGMVGEGPSAVKFNHPANIASGRASAAFGIQTQATGSNSFTEGDLTIASGRSAHAEGTETIASGPQSHAEGYETKADHDSAHAEGNLTVASGVTAHAEGQGSKATGGMSHAEGSFTEAIEFAAHSEGAETVASGPAAHAEGSNSSATGAISHAEGRYTTASGYNSHAEGDSTKASGSNAHAEGFETEARGYGSHAEGGGSKAYAKYSHTGGEGSRSGYEQQDYWTDENSCSFAHGYKAIANGKAAISLGNEVIANADYQTAVGTFNAENPDALLIVGNGTANENRKNAFVVHKDGRAEIATAPVNEMDVVNKAYVDEVKEDVDALTELPLIHSEGDNSLAQSGYDNKSYAIAGSALGYNTISGSKGYRISAFNPGDQDEAGNYINGTYTLVLSEGESIPSEIIDTPYCIYLKQSKDNVGTISAISGNIITVDGFLYPANWDEGHWEKLNEDGTKAKDEHGNQIYLTGDEWEAAKAEAYASSYIIFEGLPTIGNINVGTGAHSEGWGNIATQVGSHAEGAESKALGKYSHAEGNGSVAYYSSHSEGKYSKALGYHSHAEGYMTEATGMDSHAEGRTTKAIGQDSHAEGLSTKAEGTNSHSEGQNTLAQGNNSHAEGGSTKAIGAYSHAEGFESEASALYSHTEGLRTKATAAAAHAEGGNSQATGMRSHAEGLNTIASGDNSHSEGTSTKASANNAHSEGSSTVASGDNSHAEGWSTNATGTNSHAAGTSTTAAGDHSYAGGLNSEVTTGSYYAFAHGYQAKATKKGSFALGRDVTTTNDFQTVVGAFNDTSIKNANFVVGSGTLESNRKNSFVSYTDGRASVGADPKNPLDVATKQYVDNHVPEEEAIVILDYTDETILDEFQALVDAVKGTLVINFSSSLWVTDNQSLHINNNISTAYILGNLPGGLSIYGPGKDSTTKLVSNLDSDPWHEVHDFYSVEGLNSFDGVDVYNCKYVLDSYIGYVEGCDYIENCTLWYSGAMQGSNLNIDHAKSINNLNIWPTYYMEVNISAKYINNITIDCFDGWYEEHGSYDKVLITFKNSSIISNIYYYSESESISHQVVYENCEYIHNCYGADVEELATEEYVDQKIEESRFSGNYNDLTNKPDIPTSDDFDPKNKSAAIKLVPSDNTRLEKGWYTIATLPKSSSSLVLHGRYGAIGGRWTSFLISVEMTYMAGDCGSVPSVKVLNCSHRTGSADSVNLTNCACTKARIRYPADKSKITSNAYLDIYLNYTNNTKTDGSIDGTVQLYSKVISNTDEIDHATGKCTLATSFNAAEVATNEWSKETLIDTPKDQLIVSELPADPDTNTIYFIV